MESGLRYGHGREVRECIGKWRELLIDGMAYYSGIWLDAGEEEHKLAGMIWSTAIMCWPPPTEECSRFEKFTRVCPKTSVPFSFLDVSYWLTDSAQGHGLVTTAVMVMLQFVRRHSTTGDVKQMVRSRTNSVVGKM